MTKFLQYFKEAHNLVFTPAGIWEWDESQQKKIAIDANRVDNLSWDHPKHSKDNMGRIKLPNKLLVLDIDKAKTKLAHTTKGSLISIPSLDIEDMPIGLYTQTSRPGAYHIYYSITEAQQELIGTQFVRDLCGQKIDILQNYIVFEWHSFSPNNELTKGDILPLPSQLLDVVVAHISDKEMSINANHVHLALHGNIQRFNLVEAYLAGTLEKQTAINSFFKIILPKEYHIKNANKYSWDKFQLSYDMINKIAVKLTTTRELSFHAHVVPLLENIVEELGGNPESRKTQQFLHRQILPSLPQHESIEDFKIDDDSRTFQQLVAAQEGTVFPLFRTVYDGKARYIHLDKYSLEPVDENGTYVFDRQAAMVLHPELNIYSEEGKCIGWDDTTLPIIQIITDPFAESFAIDKRSRHVVNLMQPSQFVKEAEPRLIQPEDNLLLKLFNSVVHPDYQHIMIRYYADVIFGPSTPVIVPWIATRSTVQGGTGKSMVSITMLGKILGMQATSISDSMLASGFDATLGVRLLSVEEGSTKGNKQSDTYQVIKQLKSNAYSKSNAKYGAITAKQVKVAITGSSNQLPSLDQTDRRYLCLEPAHLDGTTEALSRHEQLVSAKYEIYNPGNNEEFDKLTQEFTNHLYYHYLEPMSDDIMEALYAYAPKTIYRQGWIRTGLNPVKTIIPNLNAPAEFMASIHDNRALDIDNLIEHILVMYNADVGKVALSWNWFADVIPLVASDNDISPTKQNITKMLDVEFKAASPLFLAKLKKHNDDKGLAYAQSFYTMKLSEEAISEYRGILLKLRNSEEVAI